MVSDRLINERSTYEGIRKTAVRPVRRCRHPESPLGRRRVGQMVFWLHELQLQLKRNSFDGDACGVFASIAVVGCQEKRDAL